MSRKRAADEDVEWQTTHNRKPNPAAKAAKEAMACGGGQGEMDEADMDGIIRNLDLPTAPPVVRERVEFVRGGPRRDA